MCQDTNKEVKQATHLSVSFVGSLLKSQKAQQKRKSNGPV